MSLIGVLNSYRVNLPGLCSLRKKHYTNYCALWFSHILL